MTKFKEWNIGPIDLLVGGTPCQSFSVAGLRKGLDDPRGNLMLTFLAIADQYRPRWLVWENVPGVLSSNGGKDFGTFLGALGELGYGFAYRILDAQYFGVAQRRRRVFVVGYLGDWRAAAAVLFERHSLSGDSAPSREKRKEVAGGAGDGARVSGLCARTGLSNSVQDAQQGHLLPIPIDMMNIRGRPSDDGRANRIGRGYGNEGDPMFTITKANHHGVVQPIAFGVSEKPDVGHCLRSGASKADKHESTTYVAQPISFSGQMSEPQTDVDMTQTLQAKNPMAVAVAVPEVMCTLRASGAGFDRPGNSATEHETYIPVGTDLYNGAITGEVAVPMTNRSDGTGTGPTVMQSMAVRRLTPVECERLQGFGDNYTNIKDKCPDGPRYKALGNSMAVPVMAWIGKRIQEVEQMQCKPNK
jgi:DNA (cytosine-5)-methyltransferase 1